MARVIFFLCVVGSALASDGDQQCAINDASCSDPTTLIQSRVQVQLEASPSPSPWLSSPSPWLPSPDPSKEIDEIAPSPQPQPAPAVEVTEAEAKNQCGSLCLESNFCCNNPDIGSNQFFSCSQACMVRYYGASEQECLNLVNTQTQTRGCSRNYGAHSFSFCSKCADLTDQCPWGVQSGDASQKGCTMDVKTNQTEEEKQSEREGKGKGQLESPAPMPVSTELPTMPPTKCAPDQHECPGLPFPDGSVGPSMCIPTGMECLPPLPAPAPAPAPTSVPTSPPTQACTFAQDDTKTLGPHGFVVGTRGCAGHWECQFKSIKAAEDFCESETSCTGILLHPDPIGVEYCAMGLGCFTPRQGPPQTDLTWSQAGGQTCVKKCSSDSATPVSTELPTPPPTQACTFAQDDTKTLGPHGFVVGTRGCAGHWECQFKSIKAAEDFCESETSCTGILLHPDPIGVEYCAMGLGCFTPRQGPPQTDLTWSQAGGQTFVKKC